MSEQKETNGAVETEIGMTNSKNANQAQRECPDALFLEVGSAGLASAALASLSAAQERADTEKADQDHSSSNPARKTNLFLMKIRVPIFPRATDHGHVEPIGILRSDHQTS